MKLFEATKQWLKAKAKGKKPNGSAKYVVTSQITEKAGSKIQYRAKELIQDIFQHTDRATAYKSIGQYNAFAMGAHEYYGIAMEFSKDFHRQTLKDKLKTRLKRPNIAKLRGKAIVERYGKSWELWAVFDMSVAPIAYVQHKNPKRGINMDILLYLMRSPIPHRSIEYNDNHISLYSGQMGKCTVAGRKLLREEIHCHHKIPRCLDGDDSYQNLQIVHIYVHKLIHATDMNEISWLVKALQLTEYQVERINLLRNKCNLSPMVAGR